MPEYPPAHKRIQFQGTLQQSTGGGAEIFDFGWADSSTMSISAIAAAAGARMHTAWSEGGNQISAYATLTGVRVEDVTSSGTVSDSFYFAVDPVAGSSDGATATVLSNCLTLETDANTGKGRTVRGRFYPPAYLALIGSTCTVGNLDFYVAAWASVLNGMISDGMQPAVASVTAGGQIADVTALSAGTVIDTVRRRRNHVTVQRSAKHSITS